MKKLSVLLLTLTMLLSTALTVIAMDAAKFDWTPESTEYEPIPRDDNVIARIVIGSDIHIGDVNATPKLENAYDAIGKLGGADVLVLAGDLTDNGRDAQFAELARIISENSKELTVDVDGFKGTGAGNGAPVDTTIAMLGNHEFFEPVNDQEVTYSRFEKHIGQDRDKLYWINGKVPLIKISMTSSSYKDNYHEKHDFIEGALKEVEASGWDGHIFVVSHMGITGTMVGAPGEKNDPYKAETVELFKKYPQIIHVSGHSHEVTMNPAFIDQSAGFTCMTDGIISEDYCDEEFFGSAALIFDVKSDGTTEFHRADFQNAKLLYDDEEWVLDSSDKPEDFIYFSSKTKAEGHPDAYSLKGSAPTFPSDAWITARDLGNHDTIEVTFSSTAVPASDYNYDYIRRYRVRAIPVDSEGSETVTVYATNDAYKPEKDRAKEMTVTLTGLDWNTDYKIEVRAITGFGTSSKPVTASEYVNVGILDFAPVVPIYDIDYSDGSFKDKLGHEETTFPLIKTTYVEELGKNAALFKGISALRYYFDEATVDKIRFEHTFETLIYLQDTEMKQEFVSLIDCSGLSFGVENGEMYVFAATPSSDSSEHYACRVSIPEKEWIHLAVTYNSKYVTVYLNGEEITSAKHTGGLTHIYDTATNSNLNTMFVGARRDTQPEGYQVTSGTMINFVRLYSGAMSADEIKSAYTEAFKPAEPDFDPESVTLPFTDVKRGSWFENAVKYAYSKKLMNGMSDTKFAPNGSMNRAMVVTVLWRMENSPAPSEKAPFTDLSQAWYKDAVAWAYENDIVNGTSETAFDPNGSITREQLAAILYRFSEYKNYDTSKSANLDSFPDAKKVHTWAKDALSWVTAVELITGKSEGESVILDPRGNATRAQVATILQRFCENIR